MKVVEDAAAAAAEREEKEGVKTRNVPLCGFGRLGRPRYGTRRLGRWSETSPYTVNMRQRSIPKLTLLLYVHSTGLPKPFFIYNSTNISTINFGTIT